MKMKRMTKQELIESITEYETLLNNKAKIRKFKDFTKHQQLMLLYQELFLHINLQLIESMLLLGI
jgi:hypothetical protein